MSDFEVETWLPATAAMAPPHSEAGRGVRTRLLSALANDDHQGAWDALMRCGWEVEPQDRIRAAWLPCLTGCDELRGRGRPVTRESVLLRCVRERVREELGRLPADVRPLWVVPSTPADDPFAHIAAAILSGRGRIARPWLWNSLPGNAPYLTVGTRPHPATNADLHAGHVSLRAHDVFWDVTTLVEGPIGLDLLGTGSGRIPVRPQATESA